ncbi:MAG: hydrogenase expression/formation protein HypE, partial [Planctomycetota bacterium]
MSNSSINPGDFSCPVPQTDYDTVQMAHGGGGRLMRRLIEEMFLPAFRRGGECAQEALRQPPHDSAVIRLGDGTRLAFTTDSFVVNPLFFPGGDIGKLAVCGTVNDLAMAGAKPLWMSAGFILEEGFPLAELEKIVESMHAVCEEVGVRIVTGDTKVVDRGKADGVFINTAGLGLIPENVDVTPARVRPGDKIILSGDVGRHGIAIMSVREGLEFQGALPSDCAPLHGLVRLMIKKRPKEIHCLRDLTRGGLASALNEIAQDVHVGIVIDEDAVPVAPPVAAACEVLGLDPLYVPNEGRMIAIVAAEAAGELLAAIADHPQAAGPTIIGEVTGDEPGVVELRNRFGSSRVLDFLSGEQLPR